MTPEQAKHCASILTAFAEGKQIQWKPGQYWHDTKHMQIDGLCEYRIKPEKKKVWVNIYIYQSSLRWTFI